MCRCVEELIDTLDPGEWARTPAQKVSDGVARLITFAICIVAPGCLVASDKPTNDVNPVRRRLLWDQTRLLTGAGAVVLLVTHNAREAERAADRPTVLDYGHVIAGGTPMALVAGHGFPLVPGVSRTSGRQIESSAGMSLIQYDTVRASVTVDFRHTIQAAEWAAQALKDGAVERYGLVPISLEDAYVDLAENAGEEMRHHAT